MLRHAKNIQFQPKMSYRFFELRRQDSRILYTAYSLLDYSKQWRRVYSGVGSCNIANANIVFITVKLLQ